VFIVQVGKPCPAGENNDFGPAGERIQHGQRQSCAGGGRHDLQERCGPGHRTHAPLDLAGAGVLLGSKLQRFAWKWHNREQLDSDAGIWQPRVRESHGRNDATPVGSRPIVQRIAGARIPWANLASPIPCTASCRQPSPAVFRSAHSPPVAAAIRVGITTSGAAYCWGAKRAGSARERHAPPFLATFRAP